MNTPLIASDLQSYRQHFENLLNQTLQTWSEGGQLDEALQFSLRAPAKRFRPSLILMLGDYWGKQEMFYPLAIAVEFFHTASLIADDLPSMDNAISRRGQPALHIAFSEDLALLASYALISEGYQQVNKGFSKLSANKPLSFELLSRAMDAVSNNTGRRGAVRGQYLDMYSNDFSARGLEEALKLKTVTLFELPLVLAWLAGKEEWTQLDRVKSLAYHFGMAFQLADDLDDFEEDKKEERGMNWALAFGWEACLEKLKTHAQSFKEEAKILGLHLPTFEALDSYFLSFAK